MGAFLASTGAAVSTQVKSRFLRHRSHRSAPVGAIEFDNLSGDKGYQPSAAYDQSKIADLLFAKELQRRFAGAKKTAYPLSIPAVIGDADNDHDCH